MSTIAVLIDKLESLCLMWFFAKVYFPEVLFFYCVLTCLLVVMGLVISTKCKCLMVIKPNSLTVPDLLNRGITNDLE